MYKKEKEMNFILNLFKKNKKEYIGLSSFKNQEDKKPEIKKEAKQQVEKTTLTGLLRRSAN